MAYRALARTAAQSGDDAAARRYLALALRTAHERDSAHELAATRLCEAEIAGARGERSRALALLDEALPAFETMRMAWHTDVAKRMRGQLSSESA